MLRYARSKHRLPRAPFIHENGISYSRDIADEAISNLQARFEGIILAIYAYHINEWRLAGVCVGKEGKMIWMDFSFNKKKFINPLPMNATHWVTTNEIREILCTDSRQSISIRTIRR